MNPERAGALSDLLLQLEEKAKQELAQVNKTPV
jgi:hypothetical protein